MKSVIFVAVGWAGAIWLFQLPYRLSLLTLEISRFLLFAILVLFVVGLWAGIADIFSRKESVIKWFSCICTISALAGIFFVVFLYVGSHASISAQNKCINNLRELDRVIEQIAIDQDLKKGTKVPELEILRRLNNTKLICPAGGTYSYGIVGEVPKCSVPGHELK